MNGSSHGLTLGVLSGTRKENERRLPIHPAHLDRVDPDLRRRILLEHDYGARFGVSDASLAESVGGLRTRAELISQCDVILLPKPAADDLRELRVGQVLWGWPHCVQDRALTQVAIDRKLTLMAFEAMNHRSRDGLFQLHVFHKNNEMAGYCSVLQAMQISGVTGAYGAKMRAAILGFGATARGAVTALHALGVNEVNALTQRPVAAVGSPIPFVQMINFEPDTDHPGRNTVNPGHGADSPTPIPLADFLAEHDIIVNCVLQDPENPMMFLLDDDLGLLKPGSMVIDVSCDEGMGFSWAKPTTFESPTFDVGDNIHYYAVDHSPSYLWNSATWEISEALLPYLGDVLGGPPAWEANDTLRRSIEIADGIIRNPRIVSFQNRAAEYPYPSVS